MIFYFWYLYHTDILHKNQEKKVLKNLLFLENRVKLGQFYIIYGDNMALEGEQHYENNIDNVSDTQTEVSESGVDFSWLEEVNTTEWAGEYFTEKTEELKDEIYQQNPETYNQKDFTRDEKTETVSYKYNIWDHEVTVYIQLLKNKIQISLDGSNRNAWFNWKEKEKKIDVWYKDISKIPYIMRDIFEDGFTYQDGILERNKATVKSNYYETLNKVENKAKSAVNILKKHIK